MNHGLIMALLLFAAPPAADTSPDDENCVCGRMPSAADVTAAWRCRRICDELHSLGDHDWAGTYLFGMLAFCTIAPESGYVAYEAISMESFALIDHGRAAASNGDAIRFQSARSAAVGAAEQPSPGRFGRLSDEMIIVRWGDYRFLVPRNEILAFCNYANASLPVGLAFYLRDRQYSCCEEILATFVSSRAPGLPDVPDEFRDFLCTRPIDARVIAVGESKWVLRAAPRIWTEWRTAVTLDAGARDGLRPGMWLFVPDRDVAVVAVVDSVSEEQASATIRIDPRAEAVCEAQVGDPFTTQPFAPIGPRRTHAALFKLHNLIEPLIRED